jgi:hypothetical protein
MKNLACRLALAAGVIAGLLTATIGPAHATEPPPAVPADASALAPAPVAEPGPAPVDPGGSVVPGGTGISQLGDVVAACPGAVPSGGTDAPAIPSLESAAALDDLGAAVAAGQVDICGIALAPVGGAGAAVAPAVGGPPAPGDLAAAAQTPPVAGSYLVDLQLDLGVVCDLVAGLLGDAAPCPPPEAPGAPTTLVDLPGLLRLQLLGL